MMKPVINSLIVLLLASSFSSCQKNDPEIISAQGKVLGTVKCYPYDWGGEVVFGVLIITDAEDSLISFNLNPTEYGIDSSIILFGTNPYDGKTLDFDYRISGSDEIVSHSCPPTSFDEPPPINPYCFTQVIILGVKAASY